MTINISDPSSGIGTPILGSGFIDILAIVKDAPRENNINATPYQIATENIIWATDFSLNYEQSSVYESRLSGEGPDPNVISVGMSKIDGTIKMKLLEPAIGWVQPIFASMWDFAGLAYWGTATESLGLLTAAVASGSTVLTINNISDFYSIPTPFNITINDGVNQSEVVSVTSMTKNTTEMFLSAPTLYNHNIGGLVSNSQYTSNGPVRDPAFSLFSLREGMLSPCMVNSIAIASDAGEPIDITINVKSLGLYRDRQITMHDVSQQLRNSVSSMVNPTRVVNDINVNLYPASANTGYFNLPTPSQSNLFAGFQGLDFTNFTVTDVSLNIENNLQEIYTNYSMQQNVQLRMQENSLPYALVSNGRKISGTVSYRSPLEPWQVVERLAGPSSLANGGLIIDYGIFQLSLSEVAWSPSSGAGGASSPQTRELQFTMVSENRSSMPILNFPNN